MRSMQLVQSAQYSTAARIASRPVRRRLLADATLMLRSLLLAFDRVSIAPAWRGLDHGRHLPASIRARGRANAAWSRCRYGRRLGLEGDAHLVEGCVGVGLDDPSADDRDRQDRKLALPDELVDLAVAHERPGIGGHHVTDHCPPIGLERVDGLAEVDERRVEDRAAQARRAAQGWVEDLDVGGDGFDHGTGSFTGGGTGTPAPRASATARSMAETLSFPPVKRRTPSMTTIGGMASPAAISASTSGCRVMSGPNSSAYSTVTAGPNSSASRRATRAAAALQVFVEAQPAGDGIPTTSTEQVTARPRQGAAGGAGVRAAACRSCSSRSPSTGRRWLQPRWA